MSPDPYTDNATSNDNHFATVLSAAMRRRNLPLQRIHARLVQAGAPVSVATLSYWQTGRSKPRRNSSLRVLAELEIILELTPGTLVSALESPRFARWDPDSVAPAKDAVTEALEEFGLASSRRYTGMATSDEVTIGADRVEKYVRAHQVLRCETPTLDRIPMIYQLDGEIDERPVVEPLLGCRLGRMLEVPSARVVIAEVLLNRRLTHGEVHHIVLKVGWPGMTVESQRWERSLGNDHRMLTTTVRFEGETPRAATRYFLESNDEFVDEPWPEDDLPGNALPIMHGEVQAVIPDAPLGIHGIAWMW